MRFLYIRNLNRIQPVVITKYNLMKKLILFISFIVFSISTQARVKWVTTTANSGSGSLRTAIASSLMGDTIKFDPSLIANGSDSIVLTSHISFTRSITIKGLYNLTDTLFISGGGTNRIFYISNANAVVLDSLALINGDITAISAFGDGGAIYISDSDSIVMQHCIFRNNHAYLGGAVRLLGSPTYIRHCVFKGNNSDYNGGAVSTNNWSSNTLDTTRLVVEDSYFLNNIANIGSGGGVNFLPGSSHGDLNIIGCNFKSNSANLGGALGIGESTAQSVNEVNGEANIQKTLFENNMAKGAAAISINYLGMVNISHSSIIRNNFKPGVSYVRSGGVGLSSFGVINLELSETSIIENSGSAISCGNIADTGSVTINNCTIYGHTLSSGGVLYSSAWPVGSICSTFVKGSILANNGDTAFKGSNLVWVSNGYNIFSDTNGLTLQLTDHLDTNSAQVNLGQLLYNGGKLPGKMPLVPSIAINAGDPNDLSDAQNIPIQGVRDIGALEHCTPSFREDTVVACGSYTWVNGITYTQSDTTAIYTIPKSSGCDSIMSLRLTILSNSFSTDTITTCDNFTWMDGQTYYASNYTAQHIVPNAIGCDSIITLYLTITNAIVETFETCDSITWRNGVTYTHSNYTAQDTISVSGSCDSIFILSLTVHDPEYTIDVITACDSLTWVNGITYYSNTNSVRDTLTNRHGCDSIVTLDLTIIHPVTAVDSVSACMFYQWIDGQVYVFDNNTATHTLQASSGCDSVVTLNLEIHYGTFATDTYAVCDSLVWIDGNTYYSDNNTATYTIVGGNSNGCDSVITLNLTVNNSQSVDVITNCGPYTWIDGNTYTSSTNTAIYTTTNAQGCDSVVTLNLTINSTTFGTETVTSCDSYLWNGITHTSNNNTATDTLVNSTGCDSIVTLNLTILNSTSYTDNISSCNPITWIDGNTYSSANNTATYTIANGQGCDSVITLNYTLLQSTTATDVIDSCIPITWIDGNVYDQSISGPTFTLVNANGCDSVVTLDFTLLEVDTTVTRNYLTITAQAINATYQWIDCVNGVITGATTASFTATQNGSYQVEVTQNGCVDTSACFSITNVGIQESEWIGVFIYPNPTSDVLYIDKGSNVDLEITMTNNTGVTVYHSTTQNQIITIPMSNMASSVYVVTLQNELGIKVERVVKR